MREMDGTLIDYAQESDPPVEGPSTRAQRLATELALERARAQTTGKPAPASEPIPPPKYDVPSYETEDTRPVSYLPIDRLGVKIRKAKRPPAD